MDWRSLTPPIGFMYYLYLPRAPNVTQCCIGSSVYVCREKFSADELSRCVLYKAHI